MSNKNHDHLLSHKVNPKNLTGIVSDITRRIQKAGDRDHISVARQLELLEQLQQFELGKFLLMNAGLNGYWTHYILTHPWFGRKTQNNHHAKKLSALECFILDKSPTVLATQQRFEIFLEENQKKVSDDAVLACIPCGMMGELLYLNYKDISCISLLGIDFDPDTLNDASRLAEKQKLSQFITRKQADAWNLQVNNAYDLISSNGLNIYEPDDKRVTQLYKEFYSALKPQGKLVTSFLTPPPGMSDTSEWLMDQINPQDLVFQKALFSDVLNVKWQCFRSSEHTQAQLQAAGFKDISFRYDTAHMFPTVTAVKQEL